MDNQSEVPNEGQRAEKAHKRRKREDRIEHLAWKMAEAGVALIKHVYSTIEDTLGKVENVELKTEALEEQVANLEEVEGELVTDVTDASEAVVDIATELNELTAGDTLTQEKLDSLTTRVQTANTGLTGLGEKLVKAAQQGKDAEQGDGNEGNDEQPAQSPKQSVYVNTQAATEIDATTWPKSGFTTTDEPPITLYYYGGDTTPGDANGSNIEGWSLYTGDVQPEEVASA